MKATTKFILFVAFIALGCCQNSPLLSKNIWNFAVNALSMKDKRKLNATHVKLNQISAYEDIKAAVCPENKASWNFLKHLETGQIIVVHDYGDWEVFEDFTDENVSTQQDYLDTLIKKYLWLSEISSSGSRPFKFTPERAEIIPFIRCLAQCFDLSEILLEAAQAEQFTLVNFLLDANVKITKKLQLYAEQCANAVTRRTEMYNLHGVRQMYCQFTNLSICRMSIRLGYLNWNDKWTNENAFHFAISRNYAEVVNEFIKAGADKDNKNDYGYTALHCSVSANYSKIAKMLIESGANLDIEDNFGRTALHISSSTNNSEITEELLNKGADKDAQNIDGCTPLHNAISYNCPKIVRMLIDAGASKQIEDKSGFTALDLSKSCGREISRMFSEENVKQQYQEFLRPVSIKSKKNIKQHLCCIII